MSEPLFNVGDLVQKRKGYRYPGVILARHLMPAGWRYNVEADHPDFVGMLHIFAEDQLIARPKTQRAAEPVAWCQPMDNGKHSPRKFLLYFEDADRGIAVFDTEAEAREAFTKANVSWNCYLFGALPLATPQPPPTAQEQALREAQLDVLSSLQATEDADIDFLLDQLGISTRGAHDRAVVRSFRTQMIQVALTGSQPDGDVSERKTPQACDGCQNTGWCHATNRCALTGTALHPSAAHGGPR